MLSDPDNPEASGGETWAWGLGESLSTTLDLT